MYNEKKSIMEEKYKRLFTKQGNVNTASIRNDRLKRNHPELYEDVMSQFPLYGNITQKLLAIKNGDYCYCATCGKLIEYHANKQKIPYCSSECGNNSVKKLTVTSKPRSEETTSKIKKTCFERYGAPSPFASDKIQQKCKKTVKEKYGVDCISQCQSVRNKMKETLLRKYGVEYISQVGSIREKAKETRLIKKLKAKSLNFTNKYDYVKSLGIECNPDDLKNISVGEAYRLISKEMIEIKLGIREPSVEVIKQNYVDIYPWLHKYELIKPSISTAQTELNEWIKSLGFDTVFNDRKTISPRELDIFIPSKNLAIEYNGVYWHDSFKIDKNYHVDKTNICESNGIQCIHIFENEWKEKPDLIKSIIMSKLGLCDRFYARKCHIKQVSKQDEIDFFEANHLNGWASSKVCYGLYHDDILVMCCSFGRSRFDRNVEWELIRMATLKNKNVVGGFSKILKHFIKQHKPKSILSYADRRLSVGNVYLKNGFKFVSNTPPNYWYIEKRTWVKHSRQKFMKHKLKKFDSYSNTKTESEIMKDSNKFFRHHDCGNMKFVMTL